MQSLDKAARNIYIEEFTSINDFDNWKLIHGHYIIHDVKFLEKPTGDVHIYIVYTVINY